MSDGVTLSARQHEAALWAWRLKAKLHSFGCDQWFYVDPATGKRVFFRSWIGKMLLEKGIIYDSGSYGGKQRYNFRLDVDLIDCPTT